MNIDTMGAEELRALIKSGGLLQAQAEEDAGPIDAGPEAVRVVTVDDTFAVEVDPARFTSWKFVRLMARAQREDAAISDRLQALVELSEYILGDAMPAALEYLGGEDSATVEDVAALVLDVVNAAAPKN